MQPDSCPFAVFCVNIIDKTYIKMYLFYVICILNLFNFFFCGKKLQFTSLNIKHLKSVEKHVQNDSFNNIRSSER